MDNRGKLYGRRWKRARLVHLRAHPLCVFCERRGRITAATVVDHKVPHRGDERLFWDRNNWQSLCGTCHDGAKQAQDRGSGLRGADTDGLPIDPDHPWNKG